jgi:hypothetical protein
MGCQEAAPRLYGFLFFPHLDQRLNHLSDAIGVGPAILAALISLTAILNRPHRAQLSASRDTSNQQTVRAFAFFACETQQIGAQVVA